MQTILLLHGAIGAKDQLEPLAELLKDNFDVHMLSFAGHGGEAFPATDFSIPMFAEQVLNYIQENDLSQVSIFGYSMGGYVGMYIAKNHPDKVSKLVTLATKFDWSPEIAEKEMKMLDAGKIEAKLPAFASALEKRHAPNNWKDVLKRTGTMLYNLGVNNTLNIEDYAGITIPCLVLLGDKDKMVSLQETLNVYNALPNAQMGMLPNTLHPIEQANIQALAFLIQQFLL